MTVEPDPDGLDRDDFYRLFVAVCRALAFARLRMKPREKEFVLLLASESFGEGSAFGFIDIESWRLHLEWRSNELKAMLSDCRRAGWLLVDVTESTFRLAPNQFPGWGNVQAIQRSEQRQRQLYLMTEDDLHKVFAKMSQASALPAKISQVFTKSPQRREDKEGNVSETFNRSTSERINVGGSATGPYCENFAPDPEQVNRLREGVREFVGERDWASKEFWNCGEGWRGRLFIEEYRQLDGALAYCKSGLQDKHSGITVKKTRGAMLWSEFQRLRREAMQTKT